MLKLRTLGWLLLVVCAFAPCPDESPAQDLNDRSGWEMLRPQGEEFGILMPKNSVADASKEPYHKMTLNMRSYLWQSPSGPVFAVVSISGIKSNPAMYTELERVNSYVDAFKRWIPKKVRPKETMARLTFRGDRTLNGNPGREYKMVLGDLSGTANVYATRKRFYAIVALNTKKDDTLTERFLSSLELPEKINEPPPPVAQNPEKAPAVEKPPVAEQTLPEGEAAAQKPDPGRTEGKSETAATEGETKPAETTASTDPTKKAPLAGGLLNGKAISLPKPDYPAEARAARISGTVVVQVTIDEYGNVTTARAISGHPLLQQPSVNAALMARFSPTLFMGEAVKVTGVLHYNFVAQ